MRFAVPEMSCGHCKAAIEKAVTGADPKAALEFDMDNRVVSIESGLAAAELTEILSKAGYESTAA